MPNNEPFFIDTDGYLKQKPSVEMPQVIAYDGGVDNPFYEKALWAYEADQAAVQQFNELRIKASDELRKLYPNQAAFGREAFLEERQFRGCRISEWTKTEPFFTNNDYTTTGYELRLVAYSTQPLPTASEESAQYDLERLYEWLMDENRKKAVTAFTSGIARNIASQIEYMLFTRKTEPGK